MYNDTEAKQNMVYFRTKQKFSVADVYGVQKESAEQEMRKLIKGAIFKKYIFFKFIFREKEKETERQEKYQCAREILISCPQCTPLTRDLAYTPGMCQDSNQ